MDIKILRLVSGEWIISEIVSDLGCGVTLKNPCMIIPQEGGVGFGPFSPFSDCDSITIKHDHILFTDTPSHDFRNGYAQQFGGVVLPEGGGSIITG